MMNGLAQAIPVSLPEATLLGPLVAAGDTQGVATPNSNGTIPQTERLFTVRSRGAFINTDAGGDRGTRAYIRLMTSEPSRSQSRSFHADGIAAPPNLQGAGNPLDQAITGNSPYGGYADFLVTQVRGNLDEKMQISETFGDGEVVYYFGRSPMMFNISGILIDSADNDWFVNWISMYGHVMRGSELARNYELLKIVLPNMDIIGTIPHMSWAQDSMNDVQINFEFQFLAKQIIPRPVTGLARPLSNDVTMLNFDSIDQFLGQQGINSIKAQANAVLSAIKNPGSTTGQIAASLAGFGRGLSGAIGPGRVSPPADSAISRAIDGVTDTINSVTRTVTDAFYSISANLAGIRASLFSPIYGVLTSLTKLVRNVMGDVAAIFNSIVSPVADIIRDVMNITGQAVGLINLVNGAINSKLGLAGLSDVSIRLSLGGLINKRGTIATTPWTINSTLRQLGGIGRLPLNSGFMLNTPGPRLSTSFGNHPTKIALLNSGPPHTPQSGAFL